MNSILYISEAVSIALHGVVLIAQSDKIVNVGMIAKATGSSKNHIAKIMQRLVKENYLKSARGPQGGFLLNKKPEDITMLEIYECIEGKIEITDCPINHNVCPFDFCLMEDIAVKVSQDFKEFMQNKTVASYLKK